MGKYAATEADLQAEVEVLRTQAPGTQDLYREVCVLLFFRHGITPTTNKLYQLVRKGSMSAPAEALTKFWETLRDKSRIRIEHPDLPQALREAAGEMVGSLWQQAQSAAKNEWEELREDAKAQVLNADELAQTATKQLQSSVQQLSDVQQARETIQQQWITSQADLARAQGEISVLKSQVDAGVEQRREQQEGFNTAQQRLTHELEQQRTVATTLTQRHTTEAKRLMLEVDRERGNALKVQKTLEQAQQALVEQIELHRQQISQKQQAFETLQQRKGELEGSVSELREQRDQHLQDVQSLRLQMQIPTQERDKVVRIKRTIRPMSQTLRIRRSL